MKTALAILLVCLLAPAFAEAQQVYRWVDEDGTVHYSDRPREGAESEKVELDDPQSYSGREARVQPPLRRPQQAQEPDAPGYARVRITAPEHDAVIWGMVTPIRFTVATDPALRRGHELRILIDGVEQEGLGVDGLPRGTHRIQAIVVDSSGRRVAESAEIAIHVRQQIIRR